VIFHGMVTADSDGSVGVCVPVRHPPQDPAELAWRVEPAHREAFISVTNLGRDSTEAIRCRPDNNVDAGLHGKNSAVENHVIQPGVVLTGVKKHPGVGLPGAVHIPLPLPGALLVDAQGHNPGNPGLNRSVQPYAQHVRPAAERDHPGPAQNHSSSPVGDLPQLAFRGSPESLRRDRERHIRGQHVRPSWRRDASEPHRDPLPAAGSVLVEAHPPLRAARAGGRPQR
jgi:hypothetical protein